MPTVFCQCEAPLIDPMHDAACRRCGLPVDFSPAEPLGTFSGSDEPTVSRCLHCGAVLDLLGALRVKTTAPGVREYDCPECGESSRYYSAAWLR